MSKKLILDKCEIEECEETHNLELHHIIERTEDNTNNHKMNLCILCANHHGYIHSGRLKIIGIFPSTKLPNKRTVVYELDGKKNLDLDQPYLIFKNKSYKIYGEKDAR